MLISLSTINVKRVIKFYKKYGWDSKNFLRFFFFSIREFFAELQNSMWGHNVW